MKTVNRKEPWELGCRVNLPPRLQNVQTTVLSTKADWPTEILIGTSPIPIMINTKSWNPCCSLEEADRILMAPGSLLEVETRVVGDRVSKVWKNLWPSIRVFFLQSTKEHANKTYVVFEKECYTFKEILDTTVKCAAIFRDVYKIQRGDRVVICSRNFPSYYIVFWACHPERADKIEPIVADLKHASGASGYLVIQDQEGKAIDLLRDPGWCIRQSSITLVGELMFKVSGMSGKTCDLDEEDVVDATTAESSRRALSCLSIVDTHLEGVGEQYSPDSLPVIRIPESAGKFRDLHCGLCITSLQNAARNSTSILSHIDIILSFNVLFFHGPHREPVRATEHRFDLRSASRHFLLGLSPSFLS
ncbi:uncharacterized protein BT62DRAFT_997785 [Guyanagaster necrorhizus]|uniref:Uncharacterized protein n=1 Tax=Guyanagaster necrorhizus TaxID=856835 RepID=A0A9P7VHD2_9AGAR|nr:uncharacterized protein BT62DRAFT_997785 [Guyanagaster necrorhizus MCA 3950]KAG7440400.1 hypothetical protein BT62DRAFT_997785 [Guyanagaster necrorhizus MCA 3950]